VTQSQVLSPKQLNSKWLISKLLNPEGFNA
jgi:hypothetical protein